MVTLPLKPDSKFVEMPDNHHWFWYMKKDSPWLEFRNSQGTNKVTAYGEIRSWIEENANGKVFIRFGECHNEKKSKIDDDDRYDDRVVIIFDDPKDYIAFKIVFPNHCRV